MSLDYQSKSGWYFNANMAGSGLLGRVHKLAGATMSHASEAFDLRAPYVATGKECRANAAKIAAVPDEQIVALLDDDLAVGSWGGPPEEFIAWVRDWQAFLGHCEGYDTDPEWELLPDARYMEWTWDREGTCGRCTRFDPNLITKLGTGHCALIADGRVHEHQHCALNTAKYVERVAVAPAPLGRRR
jgi:hypothetical protein